jgi:hypothetical protein
LPTSGNCSSRNWTDDGDLAEATLNPKPEQNQNQIQNKHAINNYSSKQEYTFFIV